MGVWESALFGQCEDLRKKYDVRVPFLRKLRELAEEKILQLNVLESIQRGVSTKKAILDDFKGLLPEDLEFGLNLLVEHGKIAYSNDEIVLTDSGKKHKLRIP